MPTIRTRETKQGTVYTIQVKVKNPVTGATVIKTTTWKPENGLTHKKAQTECEKFAELYEQSIKKLYSSACTNTLDRKITFAAFAQKWLERVQKDFSVHYYEMSIESVKWINRYLGGFKLVEITPYIIQSFYDKLDEETYTVTHITPKLNALREVMDEKHISYSILRHKFTLNPATLAKLFGGASVGIECATSVAKILNVKVELIFNVSSEQRLYSSNTIARIKRATRCIFALAKRQRLIDDNFASADYVTYSKKIKRNINFLDDKQAKELCSATLAYPDIRVKTCILLLLLTGMRRGEAAGLEWKDIDFENHIISIRRTSNYSKTLGIFTKEPKTEGSIRQISVPQLLLDTLKEYRLYYNDLADKWGAKWVHSDRLFVREHGEPMSPDTINFWFKKLLNGTDLPHVTVHSLRHTNITLQIAAGVPLVTVAARAGHSRTSTTTDIYSHFIKSQDAVAVQVLDNIFNSTDKGE